MLQFLCLRCVLYCVVLGFGLLHLNIVFYLRKSRDNIGVPDVKDSVTHTARVDESFSLSPLSAMGHLLLLQAQLTSVCEEERNTIILFAPYVPKAASESTKIKVGALRVPNRNPRGPSIYD